MPPATWERSAPAPRGAFKLTSASAQAGGLIEATFTATLDSGDALSGSFSARLQVCGTADAGSPVCK